MKTVFITSFHPLISRNILQTRLVAFLIQSGRRVVVLVPDFKREYFLKQFGSANVFVEGVPTALTKRDFFFRKLTLSITPTRTLYVKKRSVFYRDRNVVRFLASLVPAYTFGQFKCGVRLAQFLDYAFPRRDTFRQLFTQYRPDVIFATDVQNELDVRLMQEAKRASIRTVGMVRSWDNLTTKGIMRVVPNRLVVQNDIIKEEAMRYSFVPPESISIVGIPHYDRYLAGPTSAKDAFFSAYSFDPKKKLIIVAPVGNRYVHENQMDKYALEVLSELDCNILVRIPPCDAVNYDGFVSRGARVVFEEAGVSAWKGGRKLNELSREDDERLVNAFSFCDAVVTHLATMCIDAAFFDKPIVVIGNRLIEHPRWDVINYYYEYEHPRPILASGGVRIAQSRDELLAHVSAYLTRPSLDAVGRKQIVREQAYRRDGKATERLADILMA